MATSKNNASPKPIWGGTLDMVKETKNMYKFASQDENAVVRDVYLPKSAFDGKPSSVHIQVSQ